MKLKLEKAYRHSYAREFGSDDKDWYLDAYNVLVKVKKENPDWSPWERVCSCTLHIHYDGHPNRYGHHWSVSGFSDEMDKIMLEELGDSYKSYATRKDMMKDLEKIVARNLPVRYKYENGYFIENWVTKEVHARKTLVEFIIQNIVPSEMRETFWEARQNIVQTDKLISIMRSVA